MKAKTCVCDDGWYGVKCENMDCPGEPDCSNNGQCDNANFVSLLLKG